MAVEIERKFLVVDDSWKNDASPGRVCRQGYLASGHGKTVRIRIIGDQGYITIKGPTSGISRLEFEYGIPVSDAECMLAMCGNIVEKTRHVVEVFGHGWEVDVFAGSNQGLVLAEVELSAEEEAFEMPRWAGKEVTGDLRYHNAHLAIHPFTSW